MNDRNAALAELQRCFRSSGLAPPRSDGVVMLSGGADSACLAAAAVAACGPQSVYGIHLNYGLREDAERGEEAARELCARLRIDLHVERPELGAGNLQARAREARYDAAERLRARLGSQWLATGHTATDLVETVLYRLAVSPGRRAFAALPPRSGRVIRPLLALGRERTRALARAAGLPWADDPSNLDPAFARNRIRAEVLPALLEIGPGLERHVAETRAEINEDAELIRGMAAEAIHAAGSGSGAPLLHEELAAMQPALRRAVLALLAERADPGADPGPRIDRARTAAIVRLASEPEGGIVELGRGLQAVCEAGTVRIERAGTEEAPEPVRLAIPGRARYGAWELRAELRDGAVSPGGPDLATLDAEQVGSEVVVRAWQEGDRMRPLGLGGSKTLQDLFTDRGVPRSLRTRLPVVEAGGRIAWVAGVAVSEDFRLGERTRRSAVITAHATGP